ncbi:hypothetical protein [Curvivirga aplysinae]|uniref:hypothetical protein n=1 Tax=Curvivirga aplysinae TaxID=2529852 RepID=UPI0012BC0012|nr:hypothetical protein [Curvivirga aplysinae]MTI10113.1 hypothetical protein [Curvivirga aplysinae]
MKKLLIAGSLLCIGGLSTMSQAADLNSVAQLTSKISAHINQLQQADYIQFASTEFKVQPRSLRHVYVQARTNSAHINLLRTINGLPIMDISPLELKAWNEADIENILNAQMKSLDELNVVYNIKEGQSNELMTVDGSTDGIYIALLQIEQQLKSLGLPGQKPGDSYQYATMLLSIVKQLAKHQKVLLPRPNTEVEKDKRPNDNYLYALSVAAELQYYQTEYLKKDIPGGIVVPNPQDGKATSDDTIAVLKTIIADLVALKIAMGDKTALVTPEVDSNRTPADVYKQLVFAYDIIFAMEDAAAEAS